MAEEEPGPRAGEGVSFDQGKGGLGSRAPMPEVVGRGQDGDD